MRACEQISVPVGGGREVIGELCVPPGARSLVVFAHGSGSSRHSPRNRRVAEALQDGGHGTLLVDLLAAGEGGLAPGDVWLRADVPFLAERLLSVGGWLDRHPRAGRLPRVLFGSHTGAAAALMAAALRPEGVAAVISRGGRAELAGDALAHVRAPTLLIAGELDPPIVAVGRAALQRLQSPARMEVVPGASHLFEEPGALDRVAELALSWLELHVPVAQAAAPTA